MPRPFIIVKANFSVSCVTILDDIFMSFYFYGGIYICKWKRFRGFPKHKPYNVCPWDPPAGKSKQYVHSLGDDFMSMIKKEEMLTKEMIINSAKNAKPSFQKKWKQSEWLHGKQTSVADISSSDPALPNLGARFILSEYSAVCNYVQFCVFWQYIPCYNKWSFPMPSHP